MFYYILIKISFVVKLVLELLSDLEWRLQTVFDVKNDLSLLSGKTECASVMAYCIDKEEEGIYSTCTMVFGLIFSYITFLLNIICCGKIVSRAVFLLPISSFNPD